MVRLRDPPAPRCSLTRSSNDGIDGYGAPKQARGDVSRLAPKAAIRRWCPRNSSDMRHRLTGAGLSVAGLSAAVLASGAMSGESTPQDRHGWRRLGSFDDDQKAMGSVARRRRGDGLWRRGAGRTNP